MNTLDKFRLGIEPLPDWFIEGLTNNKIALYTPYKYDVKWDNITKCFIWAGNGIVTATKGDTIINCGYGVYKVESKHSWEAYW